MTAELEVGTCPHCHGRGEIEGHPDDPMTGVCDVCSGTGLDAGMRWAMTCSSCEEGDLANGMKPTEATALMRAHRKAHPSHEPHLRPSSQPVEATMRALQEQVRERDEAILEYVEAIHAKGHPRLLNDVDGMRDALLRENEAFAALASLRGVGGSE